MTHVELVETIYSGTDPASRSALAREFLAAIGLENTSYFWYHIRIVRLRYTTSSNSGDYLAGSHFPIFGAYTLGCIAKHESGVVPYGGYLSGLTAGQPAKLCKVSGIALNASYRGMHPRTPVGNGSVLIAMCQAVNGYIPDKQWMIYPYIFKKDQDGFRELE